MALAGCTGSRPNKHFVVAIDRSASTDPIRPELCHRFYELVDRAAARKDRLSLWAFDNKPVMIWGPRVPQGTETFNSIMYREFLKAPGRRMTRPAVLLREIVNQTYQNTETEPIAICVLTDGDSEIASDELLLIEVGSELASKPHITLSVIGIKPENRTMWQKAFSRMGNRFNLAGLEEAEQEIEEISRAL